MERGDRVEGRFEVEALTGRGGMGEVYRARDLGSGELVALKVLGDVPGADERFGREARLLAALEHPGIVRYVAHGATAGGRAFLAMEWLDGEDLAARLARGPLDVAASVELVRRVAIAVGDAHDRGVVHRDLKPGNVFLVEGRLDRPKLIDFGLARSMTPSLSLTATGTVLGTPPYMAPERARGERALDARSDVFALGCLLYECLTGAPPFTGAHPMAVLAKILFDEPAPPSSRALGVPAPLDALVMRALDKDPARRPADGPTLAAELGELAPRSVVVSPGGGPPAAPVSITSRERSIVSAVIAGGTPAAPAHAATLVDGTGRGDGLHALSVLAREHSAILERLAGGGVVMLVRGEGAGEGAVRAARLALGLLSIVRADATGSLRAVLPPEAPVVLATGRARLDDRLPVGEVIDRAAALLDSATGAHGVRLDELSAGLLPSSFEVVGDALGLLLAQERDLAEPARTLLGRPTPCVGRRRELRQLEAAVDECVDDEVATATLVVGDPGVGKTRLRHELVRGLADRGVEVWIGRGDPVRAGSAYSVLAHALSGAFGLVRGEPDEAARQRLRAHVGRHVTPEDVDRVSTFVGEAIGIRFERGDALDAARLDPRLMASQVRRALIDLIAAFCGGGRALALVLEDLQWADLPTVELATEAVARLADAPLFVLLVARPGVHERFPRLRDALGPQEIRIEPLRRKAAAQLVRAVLGEEVDDTTVSRLVDRADGNAFFLEELVRSEAEGRGEALPATVIAVVQARLEGLDPAARRLLRAASVFGETFFRGGARALLGEPAGDDALDAWLATLERQELVARRATCRFPGDVEMVFRHATVREAAYAMLTEEDRALGHRLAAAFLAASGEPDAAVLARHLEQGDDAPGAARPWVAAARQALDAGDLAEALAFAGRAVGCGAGGELLGEARLVEAAAHGFRGEIGEAARAASEAVDRLPAGSARWHDAIAWAAFESLRQGEPGAVEALGERILDAPAGRDPGEARTVALLRTASALSYAGRADLAARLRAVAKGRLSSFRHGPAAHAWDHVARALEANHRGEAAACLSGWEEAAARFEATGNTPRAVGALSSMGFALLELGADERARAALTAVIERADAAGLRHAALVAHHNLGLALGRLGRLEEAKRTERHAVDGFEAMGDRRMEGASRRYLAFVLHAAGDHDGAAREAELAVALLRDAAPPLVPPALATLSSIHRTRGELDAALSTAVEAMQLAESAPGLEEGESLVRLVHAQALDDAGRAGEARDAIEAARARLHERAARVLDAELRRSFLEAIPEHAETLRLAEAWGATSG